MLRNTRQTRCFLLRPAMHRKFMMPTLGPRAARPLAPRWQARGRASRPRSRESVLKYRVGDKIELTQAAFRRLCEAVLADIEAKYA